VTPALCTCSPVHGEGNLLEPSCWAGESAQVGGMAASLFDAVAGTGAFRAEQLAVTCSCDREIFKILRCALPS